MKHYEPLLTINHQLLLLCLQAADLLPLLQDYLGKTALDLARNRGFDQASHPAVASSPDSCWPFMSRMYIYIVDLHPRTELVFTLVLSGFWLGVNHENPVSALGLPPWTSWTRSGLASLLVLFLLPWTS